ncbi:MULTISPECIES: DUF1120 domain-containing protein [Pseudomonas]|jgi:type 1 fimbria pilin|uniref:DUF1120 domain-containing protein n=1 Tax=Pseudomonas quebecensis TaxID=2995174 RepID=A0ABY6QBZ0_9PSED|nr:MULTISPECIES: DUF1120 domain-containing protein [Pseudomonas]MCP1514709.1 type 1 fimbria pilin [Pseudomonas rhodesiae]MCX4065968.1 DUF1120 domain-containing protein [Pseudomonas quebecensis]MDF9768433.1 type 1 fimbria pilin [Pseudomonas rhodesiae]UZW17517.1 DUF1120 domain-containing protein [Pseudomonas quebecensis]UZW25068.1 DUF1120 domain-containing protein [Pseudomonas quebecensis]
MKMRRIAVSFLLLTSAQYSLAASTVDLSVNGAITPTACTPRLSSAGVIDYGRISQQDLNIDRGTRLAARHLQVSLYCNGASRFALRMRDNRDGTAMVNSEIYYGLGLDNSGNRIGLYSMTFDPRQSLVDSATQVYGTESTTGGVAWRTANLNPIDIGANSYLGFTDIEGSTSGPSAIQELISTVKVDAVINARQNLDLSQDVRLDGSATLEVVYL